MDDLICKDHDWDLCNHLSLTKNIINLNLEKFFEIVGKCLIWCLMSTFRQKDQFKESEKRRRGSEYLIILFSINKWTFLKKIVLDLKYTV